MLVGTVEQLKNDLNERDSTIGEQTAQLKAVQRKEQEQEERLSKVESALEIANLQLRKEIEQRKSFEAEIEMCRTIIEERNSLKKKAQENSAELGRLQDKLLKANQDLESTTAALKKAGKSLADVLGDKQTLHAKYNSLTRELEAYRN